MDEGNLPCYKFGISSLSFTEDPVFSASLMAAGMQETGSTGGSPLVTSSLHEELLLTELAMKTQSAFDGAQQSETEFGSLPHQPVAT